MTTVQLDPDVARLLLAVCEGGEYLPEEVLNRTLRIWFHVMAVCADDPEADSALQQLLDKAAAQHSVSLGSELKH